MYLAGIKQRRYSKMNEQSNVKKVIGVVSGKGGVGKSSVTSMLAVATRRMGYKVAILDADVTGPSIPQAFGIKEKATGTDEMIFPVESKTGITTMTAEDPMTAVAIGTGKFIEFLGGARD